MTIKRFATLVVYALLAILIPIVIYSAPKVIKTVVYLNNKAYCENIIEAECPNDRCQLLCTGGGVMSGEGCKAICTAKSLEL